MTDFELEIDGIVETSFGRDSYDVKRSLATLTGFPVYELPATARYKITVKDKFGNKKQAICDICDKNAWAFQEDEFVCDHSRDDIYYWIGMFVGRVVKEENVVGVEKA